MKTVINIKQIIIYGIIAFALAFSALSIFGAQTVGAQANGQSLKSGVCGGADLKLESGSCGSQRAQERELNNLIASIINIFSVIVGIIAVIMLIWGGFKFITSGGDSGNVTSARQTIIYALVGLIIVALAQFIVKFVLSKVG